MLGSILLVEDNVMDLDLTMRAFKQRNLANPIEIARDGEEAMVWVDRWEGGETPPVLVLLDLKLPRIGGLEVLRRLKASERTRPIPVVVLTTSAETADVKAAYQLGANSYILKPVKFESFVDVAANVHLYWCVHNKTLRDP